MRSLIVVYFRKAQKTDINCADRVKTPLCLIRGFHVETNASSCPENIIMFFFLVIARARRWKYILYIDTIIIPFRHVCAYRRSTRCMII